MTVSAATESTAPDRPTPQTATQQELMEIFRDVLSIQDVDPHDQFLRIGGNSLNLIEVIKQVKDKMGVTLKSRLFFDPTTSTVIELSKAIDSKLQEQA